MNTSLLLDLLSHTTLKGAAVLLVALLLGLGLRRTAAARRYALWITAITTLAVLPLAMWVLPAWHVLPQTSTTLDRPMMELKPVSENAELFPLPEDLDFTVPAAGPAMPVPAQAPSSTSFSWNISWQDVVEFLPVVWMLIAGLLLLRLGRSAWRLHRLEASLKPGECALLEQTASELGLKCMPHVLLGPGDSVPMVWGVLRPRLLLPSGFETWSPEKQRGVLLHELAHLKRGDPLALWAAQWVKALHWFNPLVWLTFRALRADQERACDDAVLRHGVRASDYAQSLLDLSRHNRLAPGLSLCALTITRCAPVEARVKAILDPQLRREGLNLRWLAGLAGCALLITLPVAMLHAIEDSVLRGRILDRNGVVLAESTKEKGRVYPLKTLAAHMIGYVGETKAYAGMEKQHDAELAAGKDVKVTLDMRMQSLACRAMNEAGVQRGAAVVLDPRTGEILAAVSLPSYDPNQFVPAINRQSWDALLKDLERPMLNRCVRCFSPGSTYKLLTGLAGGVAGITGQKFNCTGTVTYGSKAMHCWIHSQNGGGHGLLGMSEALAVSCNCYWYQFGNAAGIDQIETMGRKIGFGSAYGITEEEEEGILPSPSWLKQHHPKEQWSHGSTANTSIGQGFVLATPLQMAVLAATVGTGGKVPQPGIVKQEEPGKWRVDLTQGTLTATELEPLREGMRLAVNSDSGTGRPARSDQVVIAGKTGTAQNWRKDANGASVEDNHGWFIGFAPFENPRLAFAIIKNGAKTGGGDCGPVAKRIVEETLALPPDGSGEVKPVSDEVGRGDEKLKPAQARFDAKADAFRAVIERIKPVAETGFQLDQIFVKDGQVMMSGSASGVAQALEFRDKVLAAPFEDPLEWTCPVPLILPDGKRAKFEMLGLLVWKAKNMTTQEAVKAARARMRDPRSKVWDAVRESAGLAEVPGGRVGFLDGSGDTTVYFYLLRQEIADWLRKSLGESEDLSWLSSDAQKSKIYTAKNGCEIEITPKESSAVFKVKVKSLGKNAPAAPAKFDFDASETSRQIKALSAEPGILVKEFKMGQGKVSILGEASGMIPARKYLFKLLELGKERNLRWALPTTQELENHSVQFEANGTYGAEALNAMPPDQAAPTPPKPADQAQIRQQSDDDIRLKPALARAWAKRAAKVIDQSSSASSHSLVIDKGSLDGIVADRPVITVVGLVGKTATPDPHTTKVILLTDELCLVSAKVEGTLEQGILSGKRTAQAVQPKPHLRFLSRFAKINVGASVSSSGEGGLFPADLLLGRVKQFISGDVSGEAIVEPAVDFSTLDQVFVIEPKTEPSAQEAPTTPKPADQAQIRQRSDDDIRMKPELANQWALLKKVGLLADLPAEAVVRDTNTDRLEQYIPGKHRVFRFSIPREAARRWLLDSVHDEKQRDKILNLPRPAASFDGVFAAANNCGIIVACLNDGTVNMAVFQLKSFPGDSQNPHPFQKLRPFRPILIAPDESHEPRPAGRLAPEHHREGLTQREAMPTLNVALQTLRPTLTP